jgi:hypothetical protein
MARNNRRNAKKEKFVYKSGVADQMPSYVSAMVNPFDEKAVGTKIHDANATDTFSYQLRGFYNMQVNDVGTGALEIRPNIYQTFKLINGYLAAAPTTPCINGSGIVDAAIVGGTDVTFFDASGYTSLAAITDRYRIVSWGVRIINMEAALGSKGRIILRELSTSGTSGGDDINEVVDSMVALPNTHDLDITVIPTHIGEQYQDFKDGNSSYTDALAGYKSIGISLIGFDEAAAATSETRLNIEYVFNLEIIPLLATIGMRLSTGAAPHSHAVLEAVHNTRTQLSLVHPTPSLWSRIKAVASSALKSVGNYALDHITGGLSSVAQQALQNLAPAQRVLAPAKPRLTITNG